MCDVEHEWYLPPLPDEFVQDTPPIDWAPLVEEYLRSELAKHGGDYDDFQSQGDCGV